MTDIILTAEQFNAIQNAVVCSGFYNGSDNLFEMDQPTLLALNLVDDLQMDELDYLELLFTIEADLKIDLQEAVEEDMPATVRSVAEHIVKAVA